MVISNWGSSRFLTIFSSPLYHTSSAELATILDELHRLKASDSGGMEPRSGFQHYHRIIKSCSHDAFAKTSIQVFFQNLTKTDSSTPRILRVINVLYSRDYYIVMRRWSRSKHAEWEDRTVHLAASAVKWLEDQVPMVPDNFWKDI
ncbi:hypothetical protein BT69DRAFT_1384353 [Atractiella rhizophila]|nr:hypothetical protein BT69DRAFT_1384353 [Atractiella rhizophila]